MDKTNEPTCTIGSEGVVIDYDTHTVVIPWSRITVKVEDVVRA